MIAVVAFVIIIILVPLLNPNLIINNDTIAHLQVFENIKNGNASYLYLGQRVTGYTLVWLERISDISIAKLFLWFNFLALTLGGIISGYVIKKITKSKLAGILGIFVITFGTGAIMHLFWSGTIFNVIEMLIILPLTMLVVYLLIEKKKVIYGIIGIIMFGILLVYHPSFGAVLNLSKANYVNQESSLNLFYVILVMSGITNLIALIVSAALIWGKELPLSYEVVFITLVLVATLFEFLSFSGLTAFSSRLAMNFAIVLNMITLLSAGVALELKTKYNVAIVALLIVGIIPNLVNWVGKY